MQALLIACWIITIVVSFKGSLILLRRTGLM